jgi:hypothetical protein
VWFLVSKFVLPGPHNRTNFETSTLGDDTKMMRVRRAEKLRLKAMEAQAGAKP